MSQLFLPYEAGPTAMLFPIDLPLAPPGPWLRPLQLLLVLQPLQTPCRSVSLSSLTMLPVSNTLLTLTLLTQEPSALVIPSP